jgi:adenine/guanine phosphoribosyltransferase-like PRPP-binding protein
MEQYSGYTIVKDQTSGLLKVILAPRQGDHRSYYLRNNLDGRFSKGEPSAAVQVIDAIAKQLPPVDEREVILGFAEGSTLLAWLLAQARGSLFVSSTKSQRSDYLQKVEFTEDHRAVGTIHYVYPLEKRDQVIMLEDEISTANTIMNAYRALIDFGVQVVGIAAVVEIMNFGAREKIKNETDLELISVCQILLQQENQE